VRARLGAIRLSTSATGRCLLAMFRRSREQGDFCAGSAAPGAAGFPEAHSWSLPASGEGQQDGEEKKRRRAALTW